MKRYISLIVLLFFAGYVQGQNKAWQNIFGDLDKINPAYLKALEAARLFKTDDYSFVKSVDNGKFFLNNRSGKTYKKVAFNVNGQVLYAAATINYKKTKIKGGAGYNYTEIEVVPHSDVRYLYNNQLYCKLVDMDVNEPYKVNFEANIYNINGSVKYGSKLQANPNYAMIEAYADKDSSCLRFPVLKAEGKYRVSEYTQALSPWIFDATVSSQANGEIINRSAKGLYKGTPHLGVFTHQNGEQYSGFFGPLASMPHGAVLFRKSNNNYEWVLVIGGNVEKVVPANTSEQPNLMSLQKKLSVAAYNGDLMFKNGTQMANFPFPELLGNYNTNPVNGYGVKYQTTGSPTPAKDLLFEVGLFKDGKLHGLGYRLKGTTNFWGTVNTSPLVFNLYAEAGFFADGNLADGREFSPGVFYGKKDVDAYKNIWAKSPIDGFSYLQMNNSPIDTLQFYEKIPQSEININSNSKVFIEKLNRWVDVVGFNKDRHLIVKGDGRNVVLNNAVGNVYYQSEFSKPIRVGCPKTKMVKKYKTVTEDVNWKDSKGRTIITKIDRSGYLKPVKLYTSKKTVLDGYETVTCDRCGGTGYYNSYTEGKVIYRLDLASNNLYNKVNNALNKAFGSENADTEISLFGTTEHLQFEAESYLNLFNNDATRTYDHLNAYNKRLQYEWIQSAKNAREIYTAFADLFYLIYQKNPNASYYFITTIHANSYNETVAIVTEKYPEARKYLSTKAREMQKKK